MAWYGELAPRILPRPSSAPAGDKPLASRSLRPHYIFSFRDRPSVYKFGTFLRWRAGIEVDWGHAFVAIAHAGRGRHTKVWRAGVVAGCSELAPRILPRPSSAPAGDKPPHYIFSSGRKRSPVRES